MKIEVERVGGGPVRFSEFVEKHGLKMVVRERRRGQRGPDGEILEPFFASLEGVESKDGRMLCSDSGDGRTPEEAIGQYAAEIRGKRLVVNATSRENRREFEAPNEWLPE